MHSLIQIFALEQTVATICAARFLQSPVGNYFHWTLLFTAHSVSLVIGFPPSEGEVPLAASQPETSGKQKSSLLSPQGDLMVTMGALPPSQSS